MEKLSLLLEVISIVHVPDNDTLTIRYEELGAASPHGASVVIEGDSLRLTLNGDLAKIRQAFVSSLESYQGYDIVMKTDFRGWRTSPCPASIGRVIISNLAIHNNTFLDGTNLVVRQVMLGKEFEVGSSSFFSSLRSLTILQLYLVHHKALDDFVRQVRVPELQIVDLVVPESIILPCQEILEARDRGNDVD
jgi:hypothetical protein